MLEGDVEFSEQWFFAADSRKGMITSVKVRMTSTWQTIGAKIPMATFIVVLHLFFGFLCTVLLWIAASWLGSPCISPSAISMLYYLLNFQILY